RGDYHVAGTKHETVPARRVDRVVLHLASGRYVRLEPSHVSPLSVSSGEERGSRPRAPGRGVLGRSHGGVHGVNNRGAVTGGAMRRSRCRCERRAASSRPRELGRRKATSADHPGAATSKTILLRARVLEALSTLVYRSRVRRLSC